MSAVSRHENFPRSPSHQIPSWVELPLNPNSSNSSFLTPILYEVCVSSMTREVGNGFAASHSSNWELKSSRLRVANALTLPLLQSRMRKFSCSVECGEYCRSFLFAMPIKRDRGIVMVAVIHNPFLHNLRIYMVAAKLSSYSYRFFESGMRLLYSCWWFRECQLEFASGLCNEEKLGLQLWHRIRFRNGDKLCKEVQFLSFDSNFSRKD